MATDTEQLILSISADTAQIKRALARLPADAKTAAQGVEQAFARTDPVGRMQQNLSRSMRAVTSDTRNLTFQLNDITAGLLGGQSPFQVMIQQSSQVSQVLTGAGGIKNALTALGGAFAGLLNPIGLATSALIFGLGYAVQYFTASKEGGKEAAKAQKELAEELKRQIAVVKEVAAEWKEVPSAITAAVNAQEQFEKLGKRREAITITRRDLLAPLTDALQAATPQVNKFFELFDNTKFAPALHDMATQWQLMMAQIASGGTTVKEVRAFLDSMIAGLEALPIAGAKALAAELENVRSKLIEVTPKVAELDTAMNTLGQDATKVLLEMLHGFEALLGPLGPLISAIEQMGGLLKGFDLGGAFFEGLVKMPGLWRQAVTATGDAAREFLKTKAATADVADSMVNLTDETAKAVAKLFTLLPATARITSAVRSHAEQAAAYARYKAGKGGLAAPPGRSRHEVGAAVDIGAGVDMDVLREAVKLVPELEQLKGRAYEKDKVHVQLAGTAAKQDEEAASAAIRAADAQATAAQSLAEKQAAARIELEKMITTEEQEIALKEKINAINRDGALSETERAAAITLVTAEAAKEAEVEKLLAQAKEANLTITPQLIAQYNQLAQAKVNAIIADQQIAVANKQAADAEKQRTDALKQLNQQVEQMVSGAITGFIQDLRNGVDAGEAFNNMLNKIIDSLIQMAIQMAVKSLFGGGGGLGALFGIAHSGGVVGQTAFPQRRVDPRVFIGAPRMASGGLVGGEVPIIAHRGEMVIPKSMVGRSAPVQEIHTSLGDVNVDMSATGMVTANSEDAREFGKNVQRLIQLEMVRESRPGGLLRRVPG